ncbi:MAG: RsmB/NOP family class I SAM-dependent RNA methyltransferase [Bdellovibrionales bacterium]
MTPSARLETTIAALAEIDAKSAPADSVLSAFFRARRYVGSKDRAAIAGNVYRILRSEARLTWWLENTGLENDARALALADQLLNERLPLAQLHNLCDGSQYAPAEISAEEHAALKQMNEQPLEPAEMPELVALECPEDVAPVLRDIYGERFAEVLRALQQPAPMDVRVNTLRADAAKLLPELKAAGMEAAPGIYLPYTLRIHGRPNLNAHPAFSTGLVEVQDEGSQLLAALVDAQPGMRVFDFCAGAGGKTLALAATMQGKGRIVATDVSDRRLQRAKLRLRRADVQTVELHTLENENDPWLKRHKDGFDRVLVDAPCTGTGTWRRNPETRWRSGGIGLDELLPLQKSILAAAARLVKPGGRLIYATCSLLPAENERQVEDFLAGNDVFSVVPVADIWADVVPGKACPVSGSYLRLDPAQHGTDGFFAAVLMRKQD